MAITFCSCSVSGFTLRVFENGFSWDFNPAQRVILYHNLPRSLLAAAALEHCLLLVVEEERTVRKPADKVIAPVLLDNPVFSHVDIVPKTRLLYQFYCINKLRPFISYIYHLSVYHLILLTNAFTNALKKGKPSCLPVGSIFKQASIQSLFINGRIILYMI